MHIDNSPLYKLYTQQTGAPAPIYAAKGYVSNLIAGRLFFNCGKLYRMDNGRKMRYGEPQELRVTANFYELGILERHNTGLLALTQRGEWLIKYLKATEVFK